MVFAAVASAVIGNGSARADFVVCDPRPVEGAINSQGAGGCSFLHDGLKLYFARNRNVYVAERESTDAPWGEAVNLGPNINTPETRSVSAISPDDLELYYTVWSWDRSTHLIMRSTRSSTDEPWGPATEFTGLGDALNLDLDFASDGLSVYFMSTRSGGYGRRDIWVSTRATMQDDWGEAVNLGPNVNDSDAQNAPSISNDGLALFFQNNQTHRRLMCIRATTDDDWGPAIDLGPCVNDRPWRATSLEIAPDGSTLYFDTAGCLWQVSIKPIVDFDDNGSVGMDDLLTMIGAWGTDEQLCDVGPMPWGDGVVDEADLEVFMEHWGQKTPVYIVVDDFESYTDDWAAFETIFHTWLDGAGHLLPDGSYINNGTGSCVGHASGPPWAEQTIVHGDYQSMPLWYDNDGTILEGSEFETSGLAFYAEVQREWDDPQDWTREGVEVFTLWFHGDPDNSVEPFYVVLEDSAGNRKAIPHPDPAAVTIDDWEQWRIPLADFTDVDPTAIKVMSIGVGDPAATDPGGSGLVRIDDIELHRPSGQ